MNDQDIPTESPGPSYNPIYEKLVIDSEQESPDLQGLVAYALYKRAKRNWAAKHFHNRKPSPSELDSYVNAWTEDRLHGLQQEAASALAEFATSIVAQQEPEILRKALRGSFLRDVGTSIVAAFLYTLILIGIAVSLALAGIDLISILRSVANK